MFLTILLFPTVIYAVFFDNEKSSLNIFTAETLDIQFKTKDKKTFKLTPDSPVVVNTILKNVGNLPNINSQKFILKSGGLSLASKIHLSVDTPTENLYSGTLSNYTKTGIPLSYGETLSIKYTFSISEQDSISFQKENVKFRISNIATQTGLTYPNGFYDIEELRLKISLPKINKNFISPLDILQPDDEEEPTPLISPLEILQPNDEEEPTLPISPPEIQQEEPNLIPQENENTL